MQNFQVDKYAAQALLGAYLLATAVSWVALIAAINDAITNGRYSLSSTLLSAYNQGH
jgi:hypothetical protein